MENASPIIQRSQPLPVETKAREIWLAGGCFWGMEKYLRGVHGVLQTDVGYANGHIPNPTYEAVCSSASGYAETVRAVYDPKVISLGFLLALYGKAIDPTALNRQGGDTGSQYRTGVYYADASEPPVIRRFLDALASEYAAKIVVEAVPLRNYYLAEAYHQRYLEKNPSGYCHITDGMCAAAHAAREE